MELNVGARPLPYEIRVSPGWNLVSVPRDPEETAIGGALAAAESLSTVTATETATGCPLIGMSGATRRRR